jgi:hypothetical protein
VDRFRIRQIAARSPCRLGNRKQVRGADQRRTSPSFVSGWTRRERRFGWWQKIETPRRRAALPDLSPTSKADLARCLRIVKLIAFWHHLRLEAFQPVRDVPTASFSLPALVCQDTTTTSPCDIRLLSRWPCFRWSAASLPKTISSWALLPTWSSAEPRVCLPVRHPKRLKVGSQLTPTTQTATLRL